MEVGWSEERIPPKSTSRLVDASAGEQQNQTWLEAETDQVLWISSLIVKHAQQNYEALYLQERNPFLVYGPYHEAVFARIVVMINSG